VGGFSLVVGAATAAMMVFAPDIVALLATQEYAQAVWIIPPVAASVFFVFVYMQFANVEMYYGENRGITWISLTAAAANIVLNAVLIPIFGYLAAGWTTLASYMLLALLHYVLMKKACRKHQNSGAIFPEKLLLLLSVGIVSLAGLILVLYGLGYVRYGVFLMEVILIFCFRKRLFQFLKSMK
jgi:O-antigen/teichoic acid export membrane protein